MDTKGSTASSRTVGTAYQCLSCMPSLCQVVMIIMQLFLQGFGSKLLAKMGYVIG